MLSMSSLLWIAFFHILFLHINKISSRLAKMTKISCRWPSQACCQHQQGSRLSENQIFLFKPQRSDLWDFSFKNQSKHMMIIPPSPTIGGWQRPLSRHGEGSNLWEAAAIGEATAIREATAIGEASRQGERRPATNSQINLQPQPLLVASSNSVSWAAEPATLIPEEYFSLSWAGDPFYSVGKKKDW